MNSIVFRNVTKKYKMYNKTSDRLKDMLFSNGPGKDFYALQNISFAAKAGDVIGVIGVNGAGKSTLANLLAGVTPPTSGEIDMDGEASLIAIGSGLDKELTGRDNIEYKCLMLGFSKSKIQKMMPDIIEFADIGDFIDQPVKNYSSGMKSRLGFAISVNIDPDILIIDEALSVGDQTFKDKSLEKMNEFKEQGKTIFFISHSIREVKRFCQKALWLEAGEIKAYGTLKEVIPRYQKFIKKFKTLSDEEKRNFRQTVLDKRKQINNQNKIAPQTPAPSVHAYPRTQSSRSKYKRRLFVRRVRRISVTLFLIIIVAIGALYAQRKGFFITNKTPPEEKTLNISEETDPDPEENEKDEDPIDEEEKLDIRYVNVPSAFIRTEPNLDSEALSMGNFGQAFLVEESELNEEADIEWLKITDDQSDGWISTKVMSSIEEELKDKKIIDKLEELIQFHASINEVMDAIGTEVGTETPVDGIEYITEDNKIMGFTMTGIEVLESDITEKLDEPQLTSEEQFLYHGETYDFILIKSNDRENTVNQLSVIEKRNY